MRTSHVKRGTTAALLLALVVGCTACDDQTSMTRWSLWDAYHTRFISDAGRVIDPVADGHSTSEGQAYAMVFALVAGDRDRFDRLLEWTRVHLAGGDLEARLPGWRWGKAPNGDFRLLDENAASDADLWLVYALVEASRVWCDRRYDALARTIAELIVEHEVVDIPGLGPMVLPGPVGFQIDEQTWRLNPSYLPLFLLTRLSEAGIPGPWEAVRENTIKLIEATSREGYMPDWVAWSEDKGFIPDPVNGSVGSYDAIRTYLWAGMLHPSDAAKARITPRLQGLARYFARYRRIPERISKLPPDPKARLAPPGFYAALLPLVKHMGDERELRRLKAHLRSFRHGELVGDRPAYYDQNLVLFAEGQLDQRFLLTADGRLEPRWVQRCER